jgi:serine protease Do
MGVVSAVGRQLRPEDPMIYVQTDAPINPGNSGGPLVDTAGRLMGINTMIYSQSGGSEGVGFAAPSNIVRTVYEEIREHGRVLRGEIGVRTQTLTPLLAQGLGLAKTSGVVLSDVAPGGPAAAAGLQPKDVILSLDGKPMENGRQFRVNLYSRRVGDTVELEVARGDRALKVPVVVVERPGDPGRLALLVDPERNLVPRLGILGLTVDEDVIKLLGGRIRERSGVAVAAAASDALGFEESGFAPGDVIHRLNRLPITDLDDLHAALEPLRFGDPIVIHVERRGHLIYLALAAE